jgi:hypothetical protein
MTQVFDSVSKAFDQARRDLRAQRADIDRRLEDIDRAEAAAREALEGPRQQKRRPSVPSRIYDDVMSYVYQNPGSQQKDIVRGLGINSGYVSTALRQALEREHVETDRPGSRGVRYTATYKLRPMAEQANGRNF